MANKAPDSRTIGSTPQPRMQAADPKMLNPGDEAPQGTPGTGEDICPACHGQGRVDGGTCPKCGGSGKIIRGVGGG